MGKHILHITATFGPGGAQLRALDLICRLGPDIRHTVIAMDRCHDAGQLLPPEVKIAYLERPRAKGFLKVGLAFRQLLRQISPDLVLTYNWGAIEALLGARLAGFKALIHHEDGFGPEEAVRTFRRRRWVRRLLLPGVAALIVPSHNLAEIAQREWKTTKSCYLPNGVDLNRFHPVIAKQAGLPGRVTVGTVGGLRGEKNQILLLQAFAASRCREEGRLILAGEGPERAKLIAEGKRLGLGEALELRGMVTDPAPLYRELDIFALSSHTEQMPLSLLEAMATGLPAVSTAVGDVPNMVAAENRPFITQPGAVESLAQALDRLAVDPALRQRTGAANRHKATIEYELETCLGRYLELYQQVMGFTS